MSNYIQSTNFATKDALPSGDPLKIVKGTEINTEFNNIAVAVSTKADSASPTFTGNAAFTGTTTGLASSDINYQPAGTGAVARTAQDKMRESVSFADFTNLQNSITAIGQMPRKINLAGQSVTQNSDPVNAFGVRYQDGKVLIPSAIPTYYDQINTYADDGAWPMYHRERLVAWWKSVSAGTTQSIYIYGDSTVEMDAGYPLKAHELFKQALYAAGVDGCLTVNRGVSGTSWSDLSAIGDLGAATKLIVIKYGINDAAKTNALATMAADMRAKLAAIRVNANGGYSQLSILLMGPTTGYRPSSNQDAKWFEDVRNVYLQVAREFQCSYFDTYAWLQDAKGAPGVWLDNIGGTGEGIHPDPVAAYWIWFDGIKNCVLGDGQWNIRKSNQVWSIGRPTKVRYPSDEPQTYPFGISMWGVLASDGWPFDGMLTVHRHIEGWAEQRLRTLDSVPREAVRSGSGFVWTQWAGLPIFVGTFSNSWSNKGGGYGSAGYQIEDDGFVTLFGVVTGGILGVAIFNLPIGTRPDTTRVFAVSAAAAGSYAAGNVVIFADGNVMPYAASNATISLDGIRYRAKI